MTDPSTTILRLNGRFLGKQPLPTLLQARTRAIGAALQHERFLPPDLIEVEEVIDVSAAARSAGETHQEQDLALDADQVLLLELEDGTTLITNPQQFKSTLARLDPNALDAQGVVLMNTALVNRGIQIPGRAIGDIAQGLQGIVARVYKLTLKRVADDLLDQARELAGKWLGDKSKTKVKALAESGLSWYATKALMRVIEKRLDQGPGLYRWNADALGAAVLPGDAQLAADAATGPLLVFIHGTGSNTQGSFADLRAADSPFRALMEKHYGARVYALEHFTLSDSPIDNALQLASVLPAGARVHLITHSRGGLVGDLLCLDTFADLIDGYALDKVLVAEEDEQLRARLVKELQLAHQEQRVALRALETELQAKQLRVERYVRVASPARGTQLASSNFDVFLSVLLKLVGLVPALQGQPLYAALKRVVLEIARNRTRPNLVPGIEAMLPESPLARFLLIARPRADVQLGIIAGDLEGSGLKWLAALFMDHVLFERLPNDLVVDTASMYAGIARPQRAHKLAQVLDETHFGYFKNAQARSALCAWLAPDAAATKPAFEALRGLRREPTLAEEIEVRSREIASGTRAPEQANRPLVIVLPGVMGSHLWVGRKNRIWCDALDLAQGGLAKIGWGKSNIEAEKLLAMSYGDLCAHLRKSHEVLPFAYDWRQPLNVLGEHFAAKLREVLAASTNPQRPVRILAHSMGGLVVRAAIHGDPALWEQVMQRPGARFVMLGTPNQGSHSMVETLIGKDKMIRMLGRADLKHDLQELLDIIAGFRGPMQLLPRKGFVDTSGEAAADYFQPARWQIFKREMRDLWFGDGVCAVPDAAALLEANWLWAQDGNAPALPEQHKDKVIYVFGCADKTACGIRKEGKHWKMLATPDGDGTVTWKSGDIGGIGHRYYMPTGHGDLANDEDYFDSLAQLLESASPGALKTQPPGKRGVAAGKVLSYDAGPVPYPTEEELTAGVFGGARKTRARKQPRDSLRVKVRAMDLRSVVQPILVGHYDEDPISGAESAIDLHLVKGELRVRHDLGLYAGRIGTASAVLRSRNEHERARGSFTGAVVTGLGKYDGSLNPSDLTNAVRTGALRYLLHLQEMLEAGSDQLPGDEATLCSVLLGYNSSVNITLVDSISALIRGVSQANRQFAEQARSRLRIGALEIVELYLDTAISAAYALRSVAETLNADQRSPMQIDIAHTLEQGDGARLRLQDAHSAAYWPRLIITDGSCPPECRSASEQRAAITALATSRPPVAEKLRYLLLGQRARAETVMQQRQPGLVESLVETQIGIAAYNPGFSRTLFQLLVPQDFKEAARQMNQMIVVLDRYTADLPWELMQADDQPLATQMAMVRQLSTGTFRTRVSQTSASSAYVLGNPSSEGFGKVFSDEQGQPFADPASLGGAEAEARSVADALARNGFEVEQQIGSEVRALDAITALFERPYRILHIAAHGVHEQLGADGRVRSGVVLSDGQLLSAAEIGAMEIVPDFVFLNCCHLGKTDNIAGASPMAFNRFAYSVSRELIEMGVRAVIAAGWAVGDDSGEYFAKTFYECLLGQHMSFGAAVFEARKATFNNYEQDITWGAYQAYGDPGWSLDPRRLMASASASSSFDPVAPEELIAALQDLRYSVQRRDESLSPAEAARIDADIRKLIERSPKQWIETGAVLSALGDLYGDLGPEYFGSARVHYGAAVALKNSSGRVPLRAAEQLANFEARDGEHSENLGAIRSAIDRLEALNKLVAGTPNAERSSLLGSAYKSLAAVHAAVLLRQASRKPAALAPLIAALKHSRAAYGIHASPLDSTEVNPYATLNWLFLSALTCTAAERASLTAHARRCGDAAVETFKQSANFWDAVMMADAELAAALCNNSLAVAGAAGDQALEQRLHAYRSALRGIPVRPRDLDSTVRQMVLMARFYAAGAAGLSVAEGARVADRLLLLADDLAPGCAAKARAGLASPVGAKARKTATLVSKKVRPKAASKSAARKTARKSRT